MEHAYRRSSDTTKDISALAGPEMFRPTIWPDPDRIPESAQLLTSRDGRSFLIDGQIRTWTGPTESVQSPICEMKHGTPTPITIGQYPLLGAAEATEALKSANETFYQRTSQWSLAPMEERCQAVERFLGHMIEKREEVVRLIMWEIAKSRADAEKEFDRTVDYIRESVTYARTIDAASNAIVSREGTAAAVGTAPLGPVLCMSPYNYPLNETYQLLFPALLTGNTVVFKPPKYGVILHAPLIEAFQRSFPPGVVNILFGDGPTIITPLMKSGLIAKAALIGSEGTAKRILENDPSHVFKRPYLGLGAKNLGIITPSANLDIAVRETTLGALSYNGQRCTALKLIRVHESIAPQYLERLCESVGRLKCGMPWEPGVQITPLPSLAEANRMQELIADAIAHGAKILNVGGGQSDGTFITPAVIYPVTPAMRLWKEEQFGPIVAVAPYADPHEVIENQRQSPYGQQAAIFGENRDDIGLFLKPLSILVSRINVNSQCQRGPDSLPFAARKLSGSGVLSVSDAFAEFSLPSILAGKDKAFLEQCLGG